MQNDDLIERLRSSATAFRENTVYDSEGDSVRLIVQADECDEAADRIATLATGPVVEPVSPSFAKADNERREQAEAIWSAAPVAEPDGLVERVFGCKVNSIGASYRREPDHWVLYTMPGDRKGGVRFGVIDGHEDAKIDWVLAAFRAALRPDTTRADALEEAARKAAAYLGPDHRVVAAIRALIPAKDS
jgi:hypothetical protein